MLLQSEEFRAPSPEGFPVCTDFRTRARTSLEYDGCAAGAQITQPGSVERAGNRRLLPARVSSATAPCFPLAAEVPLNFKTSCTLRTLKNAAYGAKLMDFDWRGRNVKNKKIKKNQQNDLTKAKTCICTLSPKTEEHTNSPQNNVGKTKKKSAKTNHFAVQLASSEKANN